MTASDEAAFAAARPDTSRGATEREYRVGLADGRTLACLGLGDPSGPPVLYFHGFPGSRFEARVAAAAAGRLGLRLLAVDRPGFGQSTFQSGRAVGDWPADVAALADALGLGRFSIVAVSGGAPYALACAVSLADRLARLVLMCPLGPLEVLGTKGMLAQDGALLALAAHAPPIARAVARLIAYWMRGGPDRCLKFMTTGLGSPDRELFADAGYRELMTESMQQALLQGGRGAAWELTLIARAWGFRLEDVRMTVGLWQGLADQILPARMVRKLAAALPRCEDRYFPGEGHLSLVAHHIGDVLAGLRAADHSV